jgi:hypothetical protein
MASVKPAEKVWRNMSFEWTATSTIEVALTGKKV